MQIAIHAKCHNGRESAINRALDGITYPGKKLVPSLLGEKISC